MKSLSQYIKEHIEKTVEVVEESKKYIADEDDVTNVLDYNGEPYVMIGSSCIGKDIDNLIKDLKKFGYDNVKFDLNTILADNGFDKHDFEEEKWAAIFDPKDETKEVVFVPFMDLEIVDESLNEKKAEETIFKFRTEGHQKIESIPNVKGLYIRPSKAEEGISEFVCSSPEGIAAAIMAMRFLVAGEEEIESLEEINDYLVDNELDLDELLNNAVAVIGNDRAKEIQEIVKKL